jgi:hypothetical protein
LLFRSTTEQTEGMMELADKGLITWKPVPQGWHVWLNDAGKLAARRVGSGMRLRSREDY